MSEANERYTFDVKLSSDYYEAYFSIVLFDAAAIISEQQIIEFLKTKNITFGLNYEAIEQCAKSPESAQGVLVAKGIKHEHGKNGEIDYKIDLEHQMKPKVNEDGSVDFKNIDFIQVVKKGQILATMSLPTDGKNGTTVTNRTIPAKKGKKVQFKLGKNVVVSQDGLQAISAVDGTISVEKEKVSVIEVLEIKSDVGVKTGNINFSGDVIVFGNVITGYKIECGGNLSINGIVEGAELTAAGNILINGGIQGNDEAKLIAGGDVTSKFINNAHINCNGDIETDSLMHSNVVCQGSITCMGRKGLIIGGDIYAKHNVKAKCIGSDMGIMTKIVLGLNETIIEEYKNATERVKMLNENIKKLQQALKILRANVEKDPNNAEQMALYQKTKGNYDDYVVQLNEAKQALINANNVIESVKNSKVVANLLYQGTKIRISNDHYNVKDAMKDVEIRKMDGEIRTISL